MSATFYLPAACLTGTDAPRDADLVRRDVDPALTALTLAGCLEVGDPTAAWVRASCPNLRALDLSGTAVTDLGVRCVGRLPALVTLRLDHTAVTDAGVAALHGAARLRRLSVRGTGVSLAALDRLKRSLPNAAEFRAEWD